MRILVVGSGGREHALAWKLTQSPQVDQVFVAPGNGGTAAMAENVPITASDIPSLVRFARKEKIDLAVVGPEVPLVAGLVDAFDETGTGFDISPATTTIVASLPRTSKSS